VKEKLSALLKLGRDLGREDLKLAILAEGNVSAKVSSAEFLVKASGASLNTLMEGDLTVCSVEPVLALLNRQTVSDYRSSRYLDVRKNRHRCKETECRSCISCVVALP
jgi:rhamnose utilization protein RhaD (predicted bifunctional aldolase and dehydrogenase)